MAWYRTGSIALTNGSTAVTGTGTDFLTGAAVGEAVLAPDGRLYEVVSIASATSLTVSPAYLGATASGQSYAIVPSQSYIRDLASQAATLVNDFASVRDNAGAGKFGDGTLAAPGLRFTADENVGIRRAAADDMRLVVAGADQAQLTGSGLFVRDDKLAITGSADATKIARFEVDGFSTATTRTLTLPNANTTLVGTDVAQTLTLKTFGDMPTFSAGAVNGVPYLNASKVLTTDASKLVFDGTALIAKGVAAGSALTTLRLQNDGTGDGTKVALDFYAANTKYASLIGGFAGAAALIGNVSTGGYHAWQHNAVEAMRLNATGLGIGTAAPAYKLDVVGGSIGVAAAAGTIGLEFGPVVSAIPPAQVRGYVATGDSGAGVAGDLLIAPRTTTTASIRFITGTTPAERMRLDASGNLGVGTSSPGAKLHVAGDILQDNATYIRGKLAAGTNTRLFGLSAVDTLYIGGIDAAQAATLFVRGGTEQMRLDSSGNLLVGLTSTNASGGVLQLKSGITFPATQVASTDANTLDDYEEGTFTPTVVGTTTAGAGTYSIQVGRYTKTGNRVDFTIHLAWSAHTGTGNMEVSGLPFTSQATSSNNHAPALYHSNMTLPASTVAQALILNSATNVRLYSTPVAGGASGLLALDAAVTDLVITGHYEV